MARRHTDCAYTVLRFHAACVRPIHALELDYRLLFDIDPQHKGLPRLGQAGTARTRLP